jgi:acetyl esterase/lipase
MKKLMSLICLVCFVLTAMAQDEVVTNRYGMKLASDGSGGWQLAGKARYEKIIDLAKVPDLLVPFTFTADKLKGSDYAGCEVREFVYKKYPAYDLKLYVDMAKSLKPTPFMVYIHGGGWARGDAGANKDLSQYCAVKGGVTGVRISYTLAGQPDANIEATIQDVLDAVKFIREHAAELNIDPARMGFCGGSAGGHLSAVAAMSTPGTKVLVGFSGIYDLQKAAISVKATQTERIRYFKDKDPQVLAKASPINLIPSKDCPAVLLIHGTGDITVEWQQSQLFADALKAKGAKTVQLDLYPYYDHSLESKKSDRKEKIFFDAYKFITEHIF